MEPLESFEKELFFWLLLRKNYKGIGVEQKDNLRSIFNNQRHSVELGQMIEAGIVIIGNIIEIFRR